MYRLFCIGIVLLLCSAVIACTCIVPCDECEGDWDSLHGMADDGWVYPNEIRDVLGDFTLTVTEDFPKLPIQMRVQLTIEQTDVDPHVSTEYEEIYEFDPNESPWIITNRDLTGDEDWDTLSPGAEWKLTYHIYTAVPYYNCNEETLIKFPVVTAGVVDCTPGQDDEITPQTSINVTPKVCWGQGVWRITVDCFKDGSMTATYSSNKIVGEALAHLGREVLFTDLIADTGPASTEWEVEVKIEEKINETTWVTDIPSKTFSFICAD